MPKWNEFDKGLIVGLLLSGLLAMTLGATWGLWLGALGYGIINWRSGE